MRIPREFRNMTEHKEVERYKYANTSNSDASGTHQKNALDTEPLPEAPESRPQGNDEYEQMIAENINTDIRQKIEVAAFYIALRHGFPPGSEVADWLQAEIEIQQLSHKTKPGHPSHVTGT